MGQKWRLLQPANIGVQLNNKHHMWGHMTSPVKIPIYRMIQLRVSDLFFWGHSHTNGIIFKVIGLVQGKIYGNLSCLPGLVNVYITTLKDPPFYIMGKLIMSIAMFQFANCKRQSQRVMVQWLMGLVWLWVDSHLWWVDDFFVISNCKNTMFSSRFSQENQSNEQDLKQPQASQLQIPAILEVGRCRTVFEPTAGPKFWTWHGKWSLE